jgi:ATP-dependent 26S proteasome regulatory subunit
VGHFKVKAITDLNDVTLDQVINESDYSTLTSQNKFVQLEYIETSKEVEPFKVEPGIYSIANSMAGFHLEKTSFSKDNILEDFINTKEIEEKADCFFRNVHKYKDLGIDVATRKMLLYGAPGGGKSTVLAKVSNKYNDAGKTAVIVFPTEKYEAYQVKDFIKSFSYIGVDKLILIMEDIGGVEMEEVRRGADAGLLSLLDNNEKTLKIPTLIIATTNFPEVLMGSLTNRPGRFDDKIHANYPTKEARIALLEFFIKRKLSETESKLISAKTAEQLSPAHLKEISIRSVIHEKDIEKCINEVSSEIASYNKAFKEQGKSLGFT